MGFSSRQEERIGLYENIYQEVLQSSKSEHQQIALQNEAKEVMNSTCTYCTMT